MPEPHDLNTEQYIEILQAQLASVTKERDDANRKLAPSPCGHGHRMVDWVVGGYDMNENEKVPSYCLACRDREQVAAAERERCATTIGGANVQHGDHYAGYYGPSVDAIQLAKVIRSLGPALAIDEIRREARDKALVEAINHTCIECEKGLPLTVETDDATGIQYSTHMKKYNGDNGCPAEFLHRLRAKAKEASHE